MLFAKLDRGARELEQVLIGLIPANPGDLTILAVGIVVAVLRAADLVATEHHRNALREHQRRDEVALLARAQRVYLGIIGRAFGAAIPRAVVAVAVAILFAVRLVVLVVVGDQVAQREAVVCGYEVDAGVRTAPAPRIEVRAAGEPRGELV